MSCALAAMSCSGQDDRGAAAGGVEQESGVDGSSSTSDLPLRLRVIPLDAPDVAAFAPFSATVRTHETEQSLVVESNGLPQHNMMVGIRSWQQQVPLPQPYSGMNAWQLPRKPRESSSPVSVLSEPLRGAIALAVNGVPIFCALNNRGEDTLLAGELDRWGGHCGRADDYHYHTAPVHLEAQVGVGNPIGYALDGYPLLGYTDADGTTPQDLDEFNGHRDAAGNYHYHATRTFPYVNGGLRGIVNLQGDQVQQPRSAPARPPLSPLPGAVVTGFTRRDKTAELRYEVAGQEGRVEYSLLDDSQVSLTTVSPEGDTATEIYHRRFPTTPADARRPLVILTGLWGIATAVVLLRWLRRYRSA